MTEIDMETYRVNRKSGVVHIAIGGRVLERCNTDDATSLVEVATIEEIAGVTRKPRWCRWCNPDGVL